MSNKLVEISVGIGYQTTECGIHRREFTDIEVKNKIIVWRGSHFKIADLGTHHTTTGSHVFKLLNPTEAEIAEHILHAIGAMERNRLAVVERASRELESFRATKQKVLAEMDASTNE